MSNKSRGSVFSRIPFILILIVIFLAVFSSFTMLLLFLNKNILIDSKSIDILDTYIKAGFVLIGSTLSGIVAFFIFSLQERSKKKEKNETKMKNYQNTKMEFEENYKAIKKLGRIMEEGTLSDLANDLVDEKQVKEIFLTVYTQLDFTFYSDYLKGLSSKEYNDELRAFKYSYRIYKYIDLICSKIEDKENIKIILELIKDDMYDIKQIVGGEKESE
ncbi:hypothetical protein FZD47_18095 [Bacillus infantis]|uniref:Uncharacterized protein n=1 Tax=Bacillus infantis TaxID=324767 RepID=A0A5D4SFE3_9BACI|nr:hypothetical protein [Bacillus infantis]TYS62000.1 hypothetical protein FZD47_18095 [Bacillus infantis]